MRNWVFPYFKKFWRRLLLSAILGFLALFCAAGLLFTSGYLISKAALRPENILLIYVPIVGVRAFGIFRAFFRYTSDLASHDTVLRILSGMRTRLYSILEPAALFIRSKFRTGDLLGILSDDIEHLQDLYLSTALPAASAVLIYGMWISLLGWMDGLFALIMGLYLSILLVVFPLLSLVFTNKFRRQFSVQRHHLYEKLTDAVLGAGDWMLSGRQKDFLDQFMVEEKSISRIENRLHRIRRWREFVSELLIGGSVIALLLWSQHMAASGHMSRTLIAAFVLVTFTIAESLIAVSEAVERLPQYHESFSRLRRTETMPEKETDVPAEKGRVPLPEAPVTIDVANLCFKYGETERWAIDHLSLDVRQGERIALIGRSGAGKTTLTHLIYGALKPTRGTVTLNGVPAWQIGRHVSSIISVLNQSPHLFDTSVRNNIALGNEQASREEIVQAAKWVGLHERILQLPHGYDTQMHEAGAIFSGGQQQRLALARIMLRNTPVVILDEPTVGLDPITEKNLLQTFFTVLRGKTLIWITHHLAGAGQMDRIIFLEDGAICMSGSHRQLLKENRRYRELYRLDVPDHLAKRIQGHE
ncbi:thiol reductant ABC exporter subunit CydC [Sporolactobacillus vineae]|uniref:thiol reductant ABC exporter subunit CydC n=1 Tax=Sporolactobacillus vineae TaxID=444463 RepID=UPI000289B1E3|nr:thiol reductant ABC exporter subunit CydC [Sporolactobacillus vineae]